MKEFKEIYDLTGRPVSPTQFNLFVNCEQKWNLHYLYKMEEKANIRMVAGSTFHKIFEVATKNYQKDDFLASEDRVNYVLDIAVQLVPPDWKVLFTPVLKNFANFEAKRFDGLRQFCDDDDETWGYFNPKFVERQFRLEDEGVLFISDRILDIPAGYAGNVEDAECVFDWKPQGYDYNTDLNRQLAFMSIHLDGAYVWAFFYRNNIALLPKAVAKQSITAIKKNAKRMLAAIKEGKYKKNFGMGCHWCPYLFDCKLSMGLSHILDFKKGTVAYGYAPEEVTTQ